MSRIIFGIIFLFPGLLMMYSGSTFSAPYDSAAFALRQQAMVTDLRTQCRINQGVTDEKIRSTFLADPENHQVLIKAADALKAGNRVMYARDLSDIRCPSML